MDGDHTASTRTDGKGRFRLRLPPGKYGVTATSPSVFGCDGQQVRVTQGRFTRITIFCDTGIR